MNGVMIQAYMVFRRQVDLYVIIVNWVREEEKTKLR